MAGRIEIRSGKSGGVDSAWYDEAGRLIVEWHDFGEGAPY